MLIKRSIKVFIILTVVFVLTAATYAFASANTVPATLAGDGNGAISGITVTNVAYTISATSNPATTFITGVTLTLGAAAPGSTIQVKLLSSGSTFVTCLNDGSTTITCDTTSLAVSLTAADNLRVIVN